MTPWLARAEDVPGLVEMGAKFHAMSPHRDMGEYDPDGIGRMLNFMIESPQAVVMTNGEGLIGGTYSPIYFAPSKWMVEENFLWASKGGFELLDALLMHATAWGADYCLMSSLENKYAKAMDRLLTRRGFRLLERRYLKELA